MPPTSRGPALDPYLFYAGRFTRDAARWMMAILAVIYLAHIGIANTQIGIIFGASLAGGFLLSVVVMLTSRAVPTRAWAIAQMLITGLAGIVLIYSGDLWLLIIGGFFGSYAASGAHLGGMAQLEQTGIAAVIPQEGRTKAYSILTMSSAAGRATGALLAGLSTLLINNLEWNPTEAYQTLLWVYVGIHLLASFIYLLLSQATSSTSRTRKGTREERCDARRGCPGRRGRRVGLIRVPRKHHTRQPLQSQSPTSHPHHLQPLRHRLVRGRHGLRVVPQLLALHQIWTLRRRHRSTPDRQPSPQHGLPRPRPLGLPPHRTPQHPRLHPSRQQHHAPTIRLRTNRHHRRRPLAPPLPLRRDGRADPPGLHDGHHRTRRTSDHGRLGKPRTRPRTYPQRHRYRLVMGGRPYRHAMDSRRYHQNRLRYRHLASLPPRPNPIPGSRLSSFPRTRESRNVKTTVSPNQPTLASRPQY